MVKLVDIWQELAVSLSLFLSLSSVYRTVQTLTVDAVRFSDSRHLCISWQGVIPRDLSRLTFWRRFLLESVTLCWRFVLCNLNERWKKSNHNFHVQNIVPFIRSLTAPATIYSDYPCRRAAGEVAGWSRRFLSYVLHKENPRRSNVWITNISQTEDALRQSNVLCFGWLLPGDITLAN